MQAYQRSQSDDGGGSGGSGGGGGGEALPAFLQDVIGRHPQVWEAYQQLGAAANDAGPLDDHRRRLVKLGLAVGARAEGAVRSHTRRALREGIAEAEVFQVALLAITSIGWSPAMAALAWMRDATANA